MSWTPTEALRRRTREKLVEALQLDPSVWGQHPRIVNAVDELLASLSTEVVDLRALEEIEREWREDGGRTWLENCADRLKPLLQK